jgi:DNA-binding transcriptional ArsR family regulator
LNRVYRALGDPTRRRVLALLRDREMTAGELAAAFELSWPTMSGHFAVLREAELVTTERVGTSVVYRLNLTVLEEALALFMDSVRIYPRGVADDKIHDGGPESHQRRSDAGPGGMGVVARPGRPARARPLGGRRAPGPCG